MLKGFSRNRTTEEKRRRHLAKASRMIVVVVVALVAVVILRVIVVIVVVVVGGAIEKVLILYGKTKESRKRCSRVVDLQLRNKETFFCLHIFSVV